MKVMGIDPGIAGAIAVLELPHTCLLLAEMPVMTLGKNKHQLNPAAIAKLLRGHQDIEMTYLEHAAARPGQGVSSMFNFGMGFGMLQGILFVMQIPFTLVTPQKWKKRAGLAGADKDKARTIAQQLFPEVDLARKNDIGKAEALLIAYFGHMIYTG